MERSDMTARRSLLVMLLGSLALVFVVLRPLAGALFLAAVIAMALGPLQRWLTKKLKNHKGIAAGILVSGMCILVVAPVAALSAFIIKETIGAVQLLSDTARSDGMRGLIAKLPDSVEKPIDRALDKVGTSTGELSQSLRDELGSAGGSAMATAGAALSATGAVIFGAIMMALALFFFLKNKDEIVAWVDASSPLRPGQTRELIDEFSRVGKSVLLSALLTASAQAVVALIGYLIARVPHPAFFFALTFVIAFIPAAGAASVCSIAALFLLVTEHPWYALFLAIYAVVVVGVVDNMLKPVLMRLVKNGTHMHGGIVFFSLIGGLAAFGAIGLLLGPLAVALFLAMLRIYRRDFVSP